MTDEELDHLIASMTDDELLRLRERLTRLDAVTDRAANRRYVSELFKSGDQ